MDGSMFNLAILLRRMDDSGGGGMGLFLVLVIIGIVVFLVLRGRRDRQERLGEPIRPMGSGPLQSHTFANPYTRCPACGAAGDKMKQAWDGMRKVTWTCGYCGAVAGVQELKDEELPAGARARLGLDQPQGMVPGQPGYYPPPQGGGMGGLLTGMMIGTMLGGGERPRRDDGWTGGGGDAGSGSSGNDWGEGGGSGGDPGDSGGGGGDWGDSGGGGDWGGGGDF